MKKSAIGYMVIGFAIGLLAGRLPWPSPASHGEECHDEHEVHAAGAGQVEVGEEARRLLGMKTMRAGLSGFTRRIPVTGRVAQDADSVSHVSAGVRGTVERCEVAVGGIVRAGDVVCVIRDGRDGATTEVRTPVGGLVANAPVRAGDKVDKATVVHSIEDLSRLPVVVDVHEKDIGEVAPGQAVEVSSPAFPGKAFAGKVTFVSPRVDEESRAVRVRASVGNPGYLLKLGMFVSAEILVEVPGRYVVLPRAAMCLIDGKENVFVTAGDGKFKPRAVEVFGESGETVAVAAGIAPGEFVAADGVFLLKSELLRSQLGAGCAD